MKKQISLLLLTAMISLSCSETDQNPFINLKGLIQKSADTWIDNVVSPLPFADQLLFLNSLVNPELLNIESIMQCLKAIRSNPTLAKAAEPLQKHLITFLTKYEHAMVEKFEKRSAYASNDNINQFHQQLENKMSELLIYFYQLYYTKLYNHLAQDNADQLVFIFDEKGLIAPEKRTNPLPQPVIE